MSGAVSTSSLLRLVDEDFRRGLFKPGAPPTRFYLNLTETCQLRCAHCITRAPERTADGNARTMTLDVLNALRPHLRHAHYVGLTHAGEPMLSPAFLPLLHLLREERAGAPTVVHLLTNGLAMTPARFAEIAALGVSSLSFSVDGMSAQSNDLLRIGSHVAQLLPRIQELSQLRRDLGVDVRMGIAWTITRANIGEIEDLVRFAAGARLDWVKLEELFPVNPLAEELGRMPPGDVPAAVRRAQAVADELGVRLLDHTQDRSVFKCQFGDDGDAFSLGDDFINRMEINSCRMPYEFVCVEPNGDVKPVDFLHPTAGNVLQRDLLELWNSGSFVVARKQALARRVCLGSAPTCAADEGPASW